MSFPAAQGHRHGAGPGQLVAEAQPCRLVERTLAAQAQTNPRLARLRLKDRTGGLPGQGRLVGDDLEVAGPLLALPSRVEPAGEDWSLRERSLLAGQRRVVQDDVVDDQLGAGVGIELDVVD